MRRPLAALALILVLVAALAAPSHPILGQEPLQTPEGQLGGPVRLDPTSAVPTPPPPTPTPALSPTPSPSPQPTPTVAASTAPAAPGTVEEVVARVGPAVVTVAPAASASSAGGSQFGPAAVVSGVFVDDAGHILTIASVAEGAAEFDVSLASGETRRGRLVGVDEVAGVALLQVDGPVPAFAPPADAIGLRAGQDVVAVGSALDTLQGTITTGVVSAADRVLPAATVPFGVVQHSAPVVPGMEGGPLLDRSGNLVGLLLDPLSLLPPSAPAFVPADEPSGTPRVGLEFPAPLLAPEPVPTGLSFAVSADTLGRVVPDLLDDGRVAYPYLGVSIGPSDPPGPTAIGLPDGVLVVGVEPSGPAAAAGIRPDDRILAIDGQAIQPERPLGDLLFRYRPSDTVELTVRRGQEELTLTATLDERPSE